MAIRKIAKNNDMQTEESYTFLLPAYKATYLREAIQSIVEQTIDDWQLIVSDDCSPEDILSVVHQFDDKRIVYRRNEQNIGGRNLVEHWNLLLDLCDTEYCIMASDDDVYVPTFLEEIDKLANKYTHCNLFHARAHCIDAKGEIFKSDALYEEFVCQLDYLEQLDYYNHIECMANYVFRTRPLKDAGGFVDFPLAWGSDMATCNMLAKNGVANTKDILFSFRMSGLNISSQPISNKSITRKKFEACCLYDDFMTNMFQLVQFEDTLKNKTTFERVVKQHKHRMAGLLMWQSVSLPLSDFLHYVIKYRKKGYIESLFITFKKWIVAQIKGIRR